MAVTALWPYGGPGHPYGSFAGKVAQVIVAATNFSGGISAAMSARRRRMLQIQQGIRKDDDEVIALILANMLRRH